MINRFYKRIERAYEAAPIIDATSSIPHLDARGQALATISDMPDATFMLGDYDTIHLNPDYEPALNAVTADECDYADLFEAYKLFRLERFHVSTTLDFDSVMQHEMQHADVFRALGATTVLYAMRFAKVRGEYGGTGMGMGAFTVAPDVKTIKLGAAATLAAPGALSPDDIAGVYNLGYSMPEVIQKVRAHNANGKQPFLPGEAFSSTAPTAIDIIN